MRLHELDPEALRHLTTRAFGEVLTAVEHHGGAVEAVTADSIIAVFGLPASELLDAQAPLQDVIGSPGSELAERLAGAEGHEAEYLLLEGAVAAAISDRAPDPLVLAATRRLGFPGCRVDELADALGISERQLRRRFHQAVGYGPKTLDRILRFRRLVSQAQAVTDGEVDLARLAADLGYADQAHMTRDSVRLTGMPPARLAALWAG